MSDAFRRHFGALALRPLETPLVCKSWIKNAQRFQGRMSRNVFFGGGGGVFFLKNKKPNEEG